MLFTLFDFLNIKMFANYRIIRKYSHFQNMLYVYQTKSPRFTVLKNHFLVCEVLFLVNFLLTLP